MKRLFSLVLLLLVSLSARAEYQSYAATLESSSWSAISSKGSCELSHIIPYYGIATFVRRIDSDMVFFISTNREEARSGKAHISSYPTGWQSSQQVREVGSTRMSKGRRPFYIKGEMALRMLYELEEGMQPTFSYGDWANGKDQIKVTLSTVKFRDGLDEFLGCVAGLPPYEYDTVSDMVIFFASGSTGLSRMARAELDRLTQYLRYDPKVKSIMIAGHTDSDGEMDKNEVTARKRADTVERYLLDFGVDSSIITTDAFGERRPMESNLTPKGRAKNRRVSIELSK
ncbi:flagellar protein MotY [Solemya pervernicosa gill symbiont]|uniref:flagellar protein MotY n=1 Tax=Solemya pervernicosa gill symbiont TaxID=642797 RepID=UPI00155FA2A2|nr:OmpA family protein [Solemya pervernicosa gill symbiont]